MFRTNDHNILSWRALPSRAALALAAAVSLMSGNLSAAESAATVRDRLWIFTVYAGGDNDGWTGLCARPS